MTAILALAPSALPAGTDALSWTSWLLYLGLLFGLGLLAGLVVALFESRPQGPMDADALRRALSGGRELEVEQALRRRTSDTDAHRGWVVRCQLTELLLAQGRYAEARSTMESATLPVPDLIRGHVAFTRVELDALTRPADEALLNEIVHERHTALQGLEGAHREEMERAWAGLQGLCLSRMGRASDAVPLLAASLGLLRHRPTHVVFLFHLAEAQEQSGELDRARENYDYARKEFPGSSFGSHAHERLREIEH